MGFLGGSSHAFGPVLLAQGAVLAGIISNRSFYEGQSLLALKWTIDCDDIGTLDRTRTFPR